MEPENAYSNNFTDHVVIYNDKNFSLAIGNWEGKKEKRRVGMRWTESYTDIGYPSAYGIPKWFIVENNVALPLLVWILGKNGEENDSIIKEAIKQIISQKK